VLIIWRRYRRQCIQLRVDIRVTRWVCEKVAQNVAQHIFVKILNLNFHSGKSRPKIWATSAIFKAKLPDRPIDENFAQSGHPGCHFKWQIEGRSGPIHQLSNFLESIH
jgi:hypothetical protein